MATTSSQAISISGSVNAEETKILAKIRPFVRKATKREIRAARASQSCRVFSLTGACPYGTRCKFSHVSASIAAQSSSASSPPTGPGEEDTVGDPAEVAVPSQLPDSTEGAFVALTKTGSVIDRYYTRRYAVDCGGERGTDFYVHEHTNHMTIVGLAPSHPIIRGGFVVRGLKYAPAQDLPLALGGLRKVRVSGKRKRGAPNVDPPTIIATALTEGGGSWPLYACQSAQVIEVNKRLDGEPDLLRTAAATLGWLAVLQPRPHVLEADNLGLLLGAEDYGRLVEARGGLPTPVDAAPPRPERPWRGVQAPANPTTDAVECNSETT